MIKELQIRPFARPLLVWIAGAILQTVFSCCTYSWVLLLLPVIILTTAGLALRGQEHFCYETRWLWGVVFLSLLLFLSIQKTAYSQFEALSEHPASLLSRWAREEQQRLLEPIAKLNLTDEEKSVLATITVGYRQAMSREVRNRFSATGVAHILAVSGFHVAIVCGFLSFLFSFLPRNGCCRWIRYISLLVLLWGFAAITGLAVSSVRAALIKVHNPFLRTPWGWVTVTLSAQAGTTFLCLYYFGQFSTVFLLTNLPLTFLATLLIPASLVYMFLPEWIPGYGWLQVGVEWLAHDLLWVVDAFSQVPGAVFSFRFDFPAMLVAYGMLLSILLYGHTGRSRYLLVILFLLLIILLVRVIEDLKQCGI